jgi:hypothetical protein
MKEGVPCQSQYDHLQVASVPPCRDGSTDSGGVSTGHRAAAGGTGRQGKTTAGTGGDRVPPKIRGASGAGGRTDAPSMAVIDTPSARMNGTDEGSF